MNENWWESNRMKLAITYYSQLQTNLPGSVETSTSNPFSNKFFWMSSTSKLESEKLSIPPHSGIIGCNSGFQPRSSHTRKVASKSDCNWIEDCPNCIPFQARVSNLIFFSFDATPKWTNMFYDPLSQLKSEIVGVRTFLLGSNEFKISMNPKIEPTPDTSRTLKVRKFAPLSQKVRNDVLQIYFYQFAEFR